MECNKEEAVRAKEIAEKKMQNGDFPEARKFALKAKQLYSDIDNLAQLLTVCEVHCSAEIKINGSDMDWYGILQIERFSDEAVIKKQYRKLALSLHPDKNKFAGAEAAFKLIGEANRVLTDPAKRHVYDLKCKCLGATAAQKPAPHQANRNIHVKKQYVGVNNFPGAPYSHYQTSNSFQQPHRPTFWTCCSSCGVRFQYYRDFLNKVLRCQSCSQNFLAHDLGVHGMPPGTSWSQYLNRQGVPNQGSSKVAPRGSYRKPADGKVGSVPTPKSGKTSGSSDIPPPKESKGANNPEFGKGFKPQEKAKANGHMSVGSGNEGGSMLKTDAKKQKESVSRRASSRGRKRGRKSTEYSSESFDTCSSDEEEEDATLENASGAHPSRKSSRRKQNVSFKENLDDEDSDCVVPPLKKPREKGSSMAVRGGIVCGVSREGYSGRSATASAADGNKKRFKQTSLEEIWSQKENKTDDFQVKRDEVPISEKSHAKIDKSDVKFEADDDCKSGVKFEADDDCKSDVKFEADDDCKSDVNDYQSPDPEFYNFDNDKSESLFAVNQVWALYDQEDCMPRYYARIKKVFSPVFQLEIVWLEPSSDDKNEQLWHDADLPVGCGKFKTGGTDTVDLSMISHQMCSLSGSRRGTYQIYPKKGETWAIFKDWDMNWMSEPDKHRSPYQFQFVEILSDFHPDNGVGVSYLGKVNGFVSTFQPAVVYDGVISFCISPNELYRFSHRVPSHRLKGDERAGIPAGSFELDPAALPGNLFKSGDSGDARRKDHLDSESAQSKANLTEEVAKSWSQYNNVLGKGDWKKDTNVDNSSQQESSTSFTPKKQHTNKVAADVLKPRRSPRDLSKGTSETRGSHLPTREDIDKNTAAKKVDNHGQTSATSGQSGLTKGAVSIIHKVEIEGYDFKCERSKDTFHHYQVWALFSDKDGLPRSYARIEKIENTPDFKLHVVFLESFSPPKDTKQPVCLGTFIVKRGKPVVVPVTKFSHRLAAELIKKDTYKVYPKKGEIWAVCRNRNPEATSSGDDAGEYDIVEVLGVDDSGAKVLAMQRINIIGRHFYRTPRMQRSKANVTCIPLSEFARFSHQCCASQQAAKNDNRLKGFWEIDPKSLPGPVILLD